MSRKHTNGNTPPPVTEAGTLVITLTLARATKQMEQPLSNARDENDLLLIRDMLAAVTASVNQQLIAAAERRGAEKATAAA